MKRHITLMIENLARKDYEKLCDICKELDYQFTYRYSRFERKVINYDYDNLDHLENYPIPLFYFTIFGDTNDYDNLNKLMDYRLILTDFAEIGNLADMDDNFEKELKECLDVIKDSCNKILFANDKLCKFIKPIERVDVLEELLNHYGCHMTHFQKEMIRNRIAIRKNERFMFEEEMNESIKSMNCDILSLRTKTGLNRREFADYFGIPYRTVEDWENKKSTCASYLYNLMKEKIEREF